MTGVQTCALPILVKTSDAKAKAGVGDMSHGYTVKAKVRSPSF